MARILVVDDYVPILTMLQLSLSIAGHEVFLAKDGAVGLQLAEKLEPDLVLLDMEMPMIDGLTLCRYLKRIRSTASIPVLLMTGLPHPGFPGEAREAGAAGVLAKPFLQSALLEEIALATGMASLPG